MHPQVFIQVHSQLVPKTEENVFLNCYLIMEKYKKTDFVAVSWGMNTYSIDHAAVCKIYKRCLELTVSGPSKNEKAR